MTIDITKPLELADGTPALEPIMSSHGHIQVNINGRERLFRPDGTHANDDLPNLRNRKDPMTERPSDEIVERMVKLVRTIAEKAPLSPIRNEAIAIAALLPKTVDPLLLEAREICAKNEETFGNRITPAEYRAGERDESNAMILVLSGLRRGRELAREEG